MKNLGYYNGKTGLIEEMTVPMTDRAFYFGDGVYDAVMCRNNIPYLLSVHLDRFYKNCEKLLINVPTEPEELFCLICTLVRKVDGDEKFVYFHASRGNALRSHTYNGDKGSICIMITPYKVGNIYEKIDTVTYEDKRYSYCNIKTLNLLPSILAALHADKQNAEESIFIRDGIVTEGSHCNVSIIKGNTLITHPADCHILPGVARAKLMKSALEQGIAVVERKYDEAELMNADEIIITSSSKIARGVRTIDGISVGGRAPDLLKKLQDDLFNDYILATSALS